MSQDIKIKISNLTKIFGPKPKSVLQYVDNGMSKDELLKRASTCIRPKQLLIYELKE